MKTVAWDEAGEIGRAHNMLYLVGHSEEFKLL